MKHIFCTAGAGTYGGASDVDQGISGVGGGAGSGGYGSQGAPVAAGAGAGIYLLDQSEWPVMSVVPALCWYFLLGPSFAPEHCTVL